MRHIRVTTVTPSIYGCGMAKGSVQRKGTVWSFVVDLGPDPATGRRRQARRSGFATKKVAEAALRSLATASDTGMAVRSQSHHRVWIPHRVAVAADDRWHRRPFGTVTSCYVVRCPTPSASASSAAAQPLQLVPSSLRELSSEPGHPKRSKASSRHWRGSGYRWRSSFSATTGMRRGEVLGLRWEDVDFTGRALSIVQTLKTVRGDKHIGPPKTGKSRRRVSIDGVTLDALKAHRKWQRVVRIAAADVWSNEGDLDFTDELGEPATRIGYRSRSTESFAAQSSRESVCTIMRHSYATLAPAV